MTRRFELVEGKSAKFWEVSLDGSDMHVRWGRIGTDGQSQTKSFASDAAAEKEADKLIKEKTKKGYAETEADASASPAPKEKAEPQEPQQAEAPAKVESKPEVVASSFPTSPAPAALVVEPRVRLDAISMPSWERADDPAKAFESLLKNASHFLKEGRNHLSLAAAEDAARTTRILELVEAGTEPSLDRETAAQLLAFFGSAQAFLGARFADPELVRIALVAGRYTYTHGYSGNSYYRVLRKGGDLKSHVELACSAGALADTLPEKDFGAIVAEAEAAWSQWAIEEQAYAAIVLGRDPRFARRILEATDKYPQDFLALVASLRSPAEVVRLIKGMDTAWLYPSRTPLALLVARQGVGAAPILATLADRLKEIRSVVEVMAAVETPEIARVMGDLLDHRELKGTAREYLEHAPALAIATLATSRKQMAKSVVEALVRSNAKMIDGLLPKLGVQERAAVEQIVLASTVNVPEASASELPRVLVDPPWTRPKKKAAKAVTLELERLEMPESVAWREGQKAQWMSAESWGTPSAQGSAQLIAAVKKWVDEPDMSAPSYSRGVSVHAFNGAEDEVALECWNRMTADAFGWTHGDSVRRLVARFEGRGVPGYLAYSGKNASSAAEILARVRSPRLAPFYARVLASRGKGRAYAQSWMESFPEEAAAGLIPDALGKDKRERALAEDAIAYLGQKGHAGTVLEVAKKYGQETVAPVKELLERDPLDAVPSKLPKLPDWAKVEALPRPLLKGRGKALPASATEHLLTMLAFSPLDPPYPGIEHVKDACDPQSLVELSWALCSTWLGADGSSAGDFAMLSLAHLAGDEGARRLTPLIRKWPGEAAHARAVKGLDVLAAIGTDVALMHLHGISQKLKFKGLQAKAQEKIAQIAEARELTTEELADRLVPDLDLDENGTMVLDFGPRHFTVGFDEHLAPFVLEDGARKKDLPKPSKTDDAEKAKAAAEAYKALKKDVRAIASNQITRLEQLMCSERRVAHDVFHKFFIEHPLMIHLVRRLVWGAYVDGKLNFAFRVDAERRATSAGDDPLELGEGMEIGLLHPLAMDDATKARFGELFADYEILQPFEQLGRATYAATEDELAQKKLARFEGKSAPLGGVRGLENQGWVRGAPQDAGLIWDVTKPIPGHADLEIVVSLDPGFSAAGYNDFADTANQKLGPPVLRKKGNWSGAEGLEALGAIQMSELIRDLTLITGG